MLLGNSLYINSNLAVANNYQRFSMGYGAYWNNASSNYTISDPVYNQVTFSNENGNFVWTTHVGALSSPQTYAQWHAFDRMVLTESGNLGIGTTSPAALVHIQGVNNSVALTLRNGTNASPVQWCGGTYCTYELMTPANGNLYLGADINGSVNGLAVQQSGNVGIGTTTPGARLEVNGNVKLTSGSGASITFADGTVQSTAFTGVGGTCGGDYAESVDVSGDRTNYEPGDVLVIDPGAPGKFLRANESYSTMVAGIYSTKPGVVGRRQTTNPKTSTSEVPMAMVGIVPTKVSAENGPIKTGDLLVASSTLGRAMKGTDRSLLTGAVIGKSLGSLDAGTGVIEVLVTLQ